MLVKIISPNAPVLEPAWLVEKQHHDPRTLDGRRERKETQPLLLLLLILPKQHLLGPC